MCGRSLVRAVARSCGRSLARVVATNILIPLSHCSFGDEKLPFCVLLGNKTDLNHMRAVTEVKARNYAAENSFLDLNVSAKSGDKVDLVFTQIAAALCGVIMQKSELDSQTAVVTAAITNHQQHDDEVHGGAVPEYTKKKAGCTLS